MTRQNNIYMLLIVVLLLAACILLFAGNRYHQDDPFVSYIPDAKTKVLKLYWKDDQGNNFRSILHLKGWLEQNHKKLLFAMNAGMYKPDGSPAGLFIERGLIKSSLDTASGEGNFYLKPNGVFYTTLSGTPAICNTVNFVNDGVQYATQSGPMLVINGQIHPAFKKGSSNLNIRNGVGILPDNRVLFAMSKTPVNLYDFAGYFKSMGCREALYLDGLVSRTYLPEKKWMQTDGNFGVIIGVTADPD